ncbi:hypothetical protein BH11PLA2_BH11PLA2_25350 [soil metagenome]
MQHHPLLIPTRSRRRPLVVPFPVGLRVAVAVGMVLMMMVAFDVGYTLGSRRRPTPVAVAAVEKSETPKSVSLKPIVEPTPKVLTKPETKKTSLLKSPAVVETKAAAPKAQEPKLTPKPAGPDSFASIILPILKAKCISCHGDPATKGGLDVRSVAAIKQGGNSGTALVPGDLAASGLWKSIDDGTMPPAGKAKLTAAEIATIRKWIESEAKAASN